MLHPKLSDHKIQQIYNLLDAGHPRSYIAKTVGVDPKTVTNYSKKRNAPAKTHDEDPIEGILRSAFNNLKDRDLGQVVLDFEKGTIVFSKLEKFKITL